MSNYRVKLNGVQVLNSEVSSNVLKNAKVIQEVNASGSFTFTMLPDNPCYDRFIINESIVEVIRWVGDGHVSNEHETIFRGKVVGSRVNLWKEKTIICEGILASLSDTIQRQAYYQGINARNLLETYITNHNLQLEDNNRLIFVRNVEVADDYISCYTNMESTYDAIKGDLLDDLGGYLVCDYSNDSVAGQIGITNLDYLVNPKRVCPQTIELGKNIVDYEAEIDTNDIATRIIPLGARLEEEVVRGLEKRLDITSVNGGLDYVENTQMVNKIGVKTKVVIFDEVTIAENLKTKAINYLNSMQFQNSRISIRAIDLVVAGIGNGHFQLMDSVRIVLPSHGIDSNFMITKIESDLNAIENDVFTFGINNSTMSSNNKADKIASKFDSNSRDNYINEVLTRTMPIPFDVNLESTLSGGVLSSYRIGDEAIVSGWMIADNGTFSSAYTKVFSNLPLAKTEVEFPCGTTDKNGAIKVGTDGSASLFLPNFSKGDIVRIYIRYIFKEN